MVKGDASAWQLGMDRVRQTMQAVTQEVARLPSPSQRVSAASSILESLDQEASEIQKLRLEAIADLRAEGHSYDVIASLTGLSKARVAQLSRAAQTR